MRLRCHALLNCVVFVVLPVPQLVSSAEPAGLAEDLALAIELERRGDLREAERILLNAVRTVQAVSENSLDLAVVCNNLAVQYAVWERDEDAEKYFRRAIRILQGLPGETADQVLARTKLHLASLYIENGRVRDATKLDVPLQLAILQHPEDRVRAKTILASLAGARKQYAEAEKGLRKCSRSGWTRPESPTAG
jgi:Flp pilus assembly protein TadD